MCFHKNTSPHEEVLLSPKEVAILIPEPISQTSFSFLPLVCIPYGIQNASQAMINFLKNIIEDDTFEKSSPSQ
jgi:hypothetical protein